jgi:hypothetical protein
MNAADDDAGASGQRPVVWADLRKLSPLRAPASIPPPDRAWSAAQWAAIRSGHRSRDMVDRRRCRTGCPVDIYLLCARWHIGKATVAL